MKTGQMSEGFKVWVEGRGFQRGILNPRRLSMKDSSHSPAAEGTLVDVARTIGSTLGTVVARVRRKAATTRTKIRRTVKGNAASARRRARISAKRSFATARRRAAKR